MNTAKIARYLTEYLIGFEDRSTSRLRRLHYLGGMEALLIVAGVFEVGKLFEYKTVTVENPNIFAPWFPGTSATIIRKETFEEMILRHTKLYIMLHDAEEDSL